MALRLVSDGCGRQNIAKCRRNLGVTGLRPPPGGAQAAQIVTSCWLGMERGEYICMYVYAIVFALSDLDVFPEQFLSVVEAPEVLVLPEEFYGRLGPIPVQLWHVQVVHKDGYVLSNRGPCRVNTTTV